MKKLTAFLVFIPFAVITAGAFGVLHDQMSYTVSQEYFTRFKFIQFHLTADAVPERLRASMVGFLASWWMGVPLGVLCGLAGFLQHSAANMRRALLWSLPLIAVFTLAVALGGLAYGYLRTEPLNLAAYQRWYIPADLAFPRQYLCAGYMHNAAYLGGVLAIPVAWLFHAVYRLRTAKE